MTITHSQQLFHGEQTIPLPRCTKILGVGSEPLCLLVAVSECNEYAQRRVIVVSTGETLELPVNANYVGSVRELHVFDCGEV